VDSQVLFYRVWTAEARILLRPDSKLKEKKEPFRGTLGDSPVQVTEII